MTRRNQTTSPRKGLSRRTALALGTAGIAAGAGLAAPNVVRAQTPRTLKMATSWPKNTPGVGVNAQRVADMITAMSGGRLKVDLYAAGELVPPFEVFDAVSSGTADLGHATPYYWQGKDPVVHFFTGVPFGLTAVEHAGWLYFGGAQALWEEAYAPFGVTPFYAGSSGVQAGGWFRKEIAGLDDLKGLKMRIAGLGGEVMRRLGVNVTLLPPGDIYTALQAGTIDAAEWVGPWNDIAFGLYKVAGHYYLPAFHEFGPALEVTANTEVYESLEDDLKAIVSHAAMASGLEATADFTYHNAQSFGPLLEKEGVTVHTWPDEVVEAMAKESATVLAAIAEESDLARRVYESFVDYRAKTAAYADKMERRALDMRALALGL